MFLSSSSSFLFETPEISPLIFIYLVIIVLLTNGLG